MKRLLRIDTDVRYTFLIILFVLIINITGIVLNGADKLPAHMSGICFGYAIGLFTNIIRTKLECFNKTNASPKFDMNIAFYMNNPTLFGSVNDTFGKDLLKYMPFKNALYSLRSNYNGSWRHVLCASYNKRKNIIRVFDIIDLDKIEKDAIDIKYHKYIKLVYDIDISKGMHENITIKPLQVVLYDTRYCGIQFAFDKDKITVKSSDSVKTKVALLKDLSKTAYHNLPFSRNDSFEDYFRSFVIEMGNAEDADNQGDDRFDGKDIRLIPSTVNINIDGIDYLQHAITCNYFKSIIEEE